MDNFDLKKYLANNPLLEEEKSGNFVLSDLTLNDFTPEAQRLLKIAMKSADSFQKEEIERFELEEGAIEKICTLAIKLVGNIAATFPAFFTYLGSMDTRDFAYALINDDIGHLMRMVVRFGEFDDDIGRPTIWYVKFIGEKGIDLFTTMVAIAIIVLKKVGYTGCKAMGIADMPEALYKALMNRSGQNYEGMSGDEYSRKYRKN